MHREALVSLLSLSLVFTTVLATSNNAAVSNANHIFNAIHSSMRQWGGSLNHNGMSLFLATVPEGTQLYHGTSNPDFVKGMQWLAFEPEHALIFAGPRRPPPGKGEKSPPPDDSELDAESTPHDGKGTKYYRNPLDHESGSEREYPIPHQHDEHPERSHPGLPHDGEDREQHGPPPSHEHKLYNGMNHPPPPPHRCKRGSSLPYHECGPRNHHGQPPPLPPGHIYKPYPPPPRKEKPHKGSKRPWDPEHRRPSPGHHDEHNDDFSNAHRPPPPPPHQDHAGPYEGIELRSTSRMRKRQTQQPLRDSPSPAQELPQEERTGYLHTYVPTHDVHLLYIDGLSAGKTSNGTLDTQDLLLLNLTSGEPGVPGGGGHGGPMGGEMARAEGLCRLAATTWQGRIDGFIRLEGGFEIILCDFEKHLDRADMVRVSPKERSPGRGGVMGGFEYLQAITSRYHGIGGGRVRVDYDDFVSVFHYDGDAIRGLWDNDVRSDVRKPRLTNVPSSTLAALRNDVTSLVLSKDWSAHEHTHNWQAAADMVVARYSAPLHHIVSTHAFRTDKQQLASYLSGLLRPFVDRPARNASLETSRCVAQFLPSLAVPSASASASLAPAAHRALHAVTTRICDTLLTAHSIATSAVPHSSFSNVYAAHAVEVVDELVRWLGWTSWKDCGSCRDDEVCFIPIWPQGSIEDHRTPRCRGESEVAGRNGYWGHRGPPRGKGEERELK